VSMWLMVATILWSYTPCIFQRKAATWSLASFSTLARTATSSLTSSSTRYIYVFHFLGYWYGLLLLLRLQCIHSQWLWLPQIPRTVGSVEINAPLEWSPLLSQVSLDEFYAYDGSFTTPPCTEVVQWIVLKKPVNVARRFIAIHSDIIRFNSRLTQGLHDQLGENGDEHGEGQ
jgi:hypothetical protein